MPALRGNRCRRSRGVQSRARLTLSLPWPQLASTGLNWPQFLHFIKHRHDGDMTWDELPACILQSSTPLLRCTYNACYAVTIMRHARQLRDQPGIPALFPALRLQVAEQSTVCFRKLCSCMRLAGIVGEWSGCHTGNGGKISNS